MREKGKRMPKMEGSTAWGVPDQIYKGQLEQPGFTL